MNPQKRTLVWLNAVGGTAVLVSYAWTLSAYSGPGGDFWGGIPSALQSVYSMTMLLAVAGYFAFTRFVFRLRPSGVRIANRFDYRVFQWIYAMILVPSALWMPLTFAMIQDPSAGLWFAIRATLLVVGVGSLLLVSALLRLESTTPRAAYGLALVGSVAFAFQTAILDAVVWPIYFPV
jgi:hypothetical protein